VQHLSFLVSKDFQYRIYVSGVHAVWRGRTGRDTQNHITLHVSVCTTRATCPRPVMLGKRKFESVLSENGTGGLDVKHKNL
jgi:hypothetical protein